VTAGDSIVGDTINYTLHPSLNPNRSLIPNATMSRPLSKIHFEPDIFHEYRFDLHPTMGASFYVDGNLTHCSNHSIPSRGGSMQMKLWADGNKWWSGTPSTTDVSLVIKSIVAYYNTSQPDSQWAKTCRLAGGPSQKTICLVE
jgi:hypothetical protein